MSPAGGAIAPDALALRTAESALRVAETALRVAELALAAEPALRAPTGVGHVDPRAHASSLARTSVGPHHSTLRGRRRFLGWAVLLHELRRVRAAQRAAGMLAPLPAAPLALSAAQGAGSSVAAPRQTHLRCVDPAWLSDALLPSAHPVIAPVAGVR